MGGKMTPSHDEQKQSRRWPAMVTGGLIVVVFSALVLWGLGWGIPSQRRTRLEGASPAARGLSKEVLQESWRHWGSRGRRSRWANAYPRHLFNPIRSYHPDEYQVFKSLSNMVPRRLDFDPGNYIYPSLHTHLVGAALGACSLLGVVRLQRGLDYYFDHPGQMGRLYLAGRALSLLAAAGTLLLVWRLGEKMQRGVGLLALGLLAAMPAFGVHSHNLTRDTCAALAVVALFACCRKLAQTGAAKWYDLAGAMAGLCVAMQYFAAVLWALIPLSALLRFRREGGSARSVAAGVGVSLLVMVAVFFLVCPYHLLNADRFLADFRSETGHVGEGGVLARIVSLGWATHLPRMMPALMTWPMAVVALFGVVVALVRRRDDDWLLVAWLALWAGVVGFDGRSYSRYYVPLLPGLALLGARGLLLAGEGLRGVLRVRWARVGVSAVVLIGVVGPAAAMTWAWSRLYALENVRTVAGQWIASELPEGARIGVTKWPWQFEMPPIDPGRFRLAVLEDSSRRSPHDRERLGHLRPDYFVTSSFQCGKIEQSRAELEDEADRFWHFLLVNYRVLMEFRVRLWLFERPIDLSRYPEDMRYVSPVIYVLERRVSEVRGERGGHRA